MSTLADKKIGNWLRNLAKDNVIYFVETGNHMGETAEWGAKLFHQACRFHSVSCCQPHSRRTRRMDHSYGWQGADPERSSRMEPESALEPGSWRKNAAQNMIFLRTAQRCRTGSRFAKKKPQSEVAVVRDIQAVLASV